MNISCQSYCISDLNIFCAIYIPLVYRNVHLTAYLLVCLPLPPYRNKGPGTKSAPPFTDATSYVWEVTLQYQDTGDFELIGNASNLLGWVWRLILRGKCEREWLISRCKECHWSFDVASTSDYCNVCDCQLFDFMYSDKCRSIDQIHKKEILTNSKSFERRTPLTP